MTQKDKELLLKDLCARLPYGVKVKITSRESKNRVVHLTEDNICHLTSGWWSECKPYLFPLSSMTEEQKSQYSYFLTRIIDGYDASLLLNWLNVNHFDYRGLIEKGLAIDATGLNIFLPRLPITGQWIPSGPNTQRVYRERYNESLI